MPHTFTVRDTIFIAPPLPTGLYVVATPIGNLGDVTLRALETLAASDVIACEDTRTSGVLLARYGIDRPKISYTEHNAGERGADLVRQIAEGAVISLISDAGTPLVSDPGQRLVSAVVEAGLPVVPLPGASAPLAALAGSGLSTDDFWFCGFLPTKQGARAKRLEALQRAEETLVFFESPARLTASLEAMSDAFGPGRRAVVARELTKMHETFHRGTLRTLAAEFAEMERVRGEIVVLVEGAAAAQHSSEDMDALLLEALATMKTKDAARHVAEKTGASRSALYERALAIKKDG